MTPAPDPGTSDFADSDEGLVHGLDSDEGLVHGLEGSARGSPMLPDISSATRPSLRRHQRSGSGSGSGEIVPLRADSDSGEIVPLRVDSSGGRPALADGESSLEVPPYDREATQAPGYVARSQRDTDLAYVEEGLPPDPRPRDPSASGRGSSRQARAPGDDGSDAVSGWGGSDARLAPPEPSEIERRLMQTLELSPEEVSAATGGGGIRDSWDDYVLDAFESHGDTPIILPLPSETGAIFGSLSESSLDVVIPLPEDAPPLRAGAPAPRKGGARTAQPRTGAAPEARGGADAPGQASDVGFVGGLDAARGAPTTAGRLAGIWKGDALWVLLSVGLASAGPLLIAAAWDYYGSGARDGHPWDEQLRPSGTFGLWFGIAGSILFLLNLTYVLRRRLRLLAKRVSLRTWLNLHFVFGLAGGSMILVHSALLTDNLIARVSSAAIFVAIASGIFGRYVLSHVSRREEGDDAARTELAVYLAQLRGDLRRKLTGQPRLRRLALTALEETAPPEEQRARGLLVIPALVLGDLRAAGQRRRFRVQLEEAMTKETGGDPELEGLIEETLEMVQLHGRLGQRLTQFDAVHDLMDTWRALHMILALIMVVTMTLHVVIVMQYNRSAIWGF